MNRFHIHLTVTDLAQSVAFYETLFAAAPTVRKDDYAKWLLDDPRVHFAISTHGEVPGLNHLGIQAETGEELAVLDARLAALPAVVVRESKTACCYAESEKAWVADPQGVPWEAYHTMGEARVFLPETDATARSCCVPQAVVPLTITRRD